MSEVIYMITTNDSYELPLCVGNAKECSNFLNLTVGNFHSVLSKHKHNVCDRWYTNYQIHRIGEEEQCN